jgi:hypothetical protein
LLSLRHQTLIIPAVISLVLFVATSYILYPLWQRYQARYSQYLPLDSLSSQTSSLRARMLGWLNPWRRRLQDRLVVAGGGGETASDAGFDSDDGEELSQVGDEAELAARRDLERRGSWRGGEADSGRRLSRE